MLGWAIAPMYDKIMYYTFNLSFTEKLVAGISLGCPG